MFEKIMADLEADQREIKQIILDSARNTPTHEQMRELLLYSLENPGKMIRSRLMLLIAGAYDAAQRNELLSSAAAVEMVHTSSLILDDIIDDSALRRGRPTVQAVYGKPIALCGGDTLMAAGINLLLERGYPRMASEIIDIIENACAGEMLQHLQKKNVDVTEEAYLAAIRGKTAYAFRGSCRMSALAVGRSEEQCSDSARFGECVGMMFQIRDDLLDWTMDEEQLGKPSNLDFSEGIYTLPALFAFRSEKYGDRLRQLAAQKVLSAQDLMEVRRIVEESGGIERTVEYLRGLGAEAYGLLEKLSGSQTEAIRSLVDALTEL